MRLNRFLASAGLGSRRSCEELIRTGQVTINGVKCEALATTVEPADVVKVGNRVLHSAPSMTLILHKPPGFVCTASDTHDRRTVFDLVPADFPRLFHVGRLDKDSEGLLILTNDGALSLKLTHPRYKVEKEYEVTLDQPFDFSKAEKLLSGIRLQDGWAKAESIFRLGANKLKVILRQGMKRQIRLMFYELGYDVTKLVRVRIGSIGIDGIPSAHWRPLKPAEIEELLANAETAEAETQAAAQETGSASPEPARQTDHEASSGPEQAERPPRQPRSERPPRDSRPARAPRGDSRGPRPYQNRPQHGERPSRGPFPPRGDRPDRPRGDVEAIPFVPRAAQGDAGRGERPERPRSFDRADRPQRQPYFQQRERPYPSRERAYSDDRPPRYDRPDRSAGPRRDVENIPFVPRASRPGAERPGRPEGSDRHARPQRNDRPAPAYRSGPHGRRDDDRRDAGHAGRPQHPGRPSYTQRREGR